MTSMGATRADGQCCSSHATTSSFWLRERLHVEYTSAALQCNDVCARPSPLSFAIGANSRNPFHNSARCKPVTVAMRSGSRTLRSKLSQPQPLKLLLLPPAVLCAANFATCLIEPSCVHSASTRTLEKSCTGGGIKHREGECSVKALLLSQLATSVSVALLRARCCSM